MNAIREEIIKNKMTGPKFALNFCHPSLRQPPMVHGPPLTDPPPPTPAGKGSSKTSFRGFQSSPIPSCQAQSVGSRVPSIKYSRALSLDKANRFAFAGNVNFVRIIRLFTFLRLFFLFLSWLTSSHLSFGRPCGMDGGGGAGEACAASAPSNSCKVFQPSAPGCQAKSVGSNCPAANISRAVASDRDRIAVRLG